MCIFPDETAYPSSSDMGRSIFTFASLLPPLSVVEERYVIVPPNETLTVRWDKAMRVLFFLEGGLELELPDGSRTALGFGDAISTSMPWARKYRSIIPDREVRCHVLVIRFSIAVPGKKGGRGAARGVEAKLEQQLISQLGGFHHFPQALQKEGVELLQQIRAEGEKRSGASAWKVSGLGLALVAMLLKSARSEEFPPAARVGRGPALVEHARHYLREKFHENLTLTGIAWQVQLSGEHLERLFRKHAGMTVFACLDQIRIERAKQLLLTTDLAVVRIAARCGFSSSTLFGRHFKARVGLTPLTYRLQARTHEHFSPSELGST